MRRIAIPLLLIFLSLTVAGCSLFAVSEKLDEDIDAGTNLITNGSFEDMDIDTSRPVGWDTYLFDNSTVNFLVDSQVFRSGSKSVKLEGVESGVAPRGRWSQKYIDLGEAAAGGTFRISAWFRTEGITKREAVRMRLSFIDDGGNYVETRDNPTFEWILPSDDYYDHEGKVYFRVYAEKLPSPGQWEKIEAVVKAPTDSAQFQVELFLWQDVGTLWWDDVVVERIDS